MVHLCIFPETTLLDLKKYIRLFAMLQYTHVVLEFWGSLKFDTLSALAWENAYTKNEIKEVIKEAKFLGIEPIPMFNQLGHATASRFCYGKHVVLDQNPKLQYLFTPDGWTWDINSETVFELFRQIRKELYELFEKSTGMTFKSADALNPPFALGNANAISDGRLLSMTVPVYKTGKTDANGDFIFTIFVYRLGYDKLKADALRSYEIKINAEQYGLTANKNGVKKAIKVDLSSYDITVAAGETLGYCADGDTLIPAYIARIKSKSELSDRAEQN